MPTNLRFNNHLYLPCCPQGNKALNETWKCRVVGCLLTKYSRSSGSPIISLFLVATEHLLHQMRMRDLRLPFKNWGVLKRGPCTF